MLGRGVRLPVLRRWIEYGAIGFAVLAFAYWFSQILNEPVEAFRIDVFVYRAGVEAMLAGRPLYEPVLHQLYFVYPPFAAVLFWPMTLLDDQELGIVWMALNLLGVIWAVGVCSREARGAGSLISRGAAAALGFGFMFVLIPLSDTMWLGQINIALMVLVLADLVGLFGHGRRRRWAGVLIGLAAGIKLTPLLFVVLLLWNRRWRAAGLALGTFALTVAVGFVALPRDAVQFWTVALRDTTRIAPAEWVVNQSLEGVLARFWPDAPGWVWFAGASAVCGVAIWVGGRLLNRRLPLLAGAIVGVASAVAAPFSWEHHWIWLVVLVWWPLCATIVGLVAGDRRWPWWAFWGVFALLLTFRYDLDGRGVGSFYLGGGDISSPWTIAYPAGAVAIIAALAIAELAGHGARAPRGRLPASSGPASSGPEAAEPGRKES